MPRVDDKAQADAEAQALAMQAAAEAQAQAEAEAAAKAAASAGAYRYRVVSSNYLPHEVGAELAFDEPVAEHLLRHLTLVE